MRERETSAEREREREREKRVLLFTFGTVHYVHLKLLVCEVRVTVGDSDLCCCVNVMFVEG